MLETALQERRQFERRKLDKSRSLAAKTFIFDPSTYGLTRCTMLNISISGASMETENAKPLPQKFKLLMALEEYSLDCKLVWRLDNKVGVEFARPPNLGINPATFGDLLGP
jgi:hypothetical protein